MEQRDTNILIDSPKILTVDANFDLSENVVEFIIDNYEKYFSSDKLKFQINMIIDEVFGNISRYAYSNGDGKVNILSWIDRDPMRLNIKFVDNGSPFNPLEIDKPDITSALDDRVVGGLGIFIIKSIVDSFIYKYSNNCNILTITKNLK